MSAALRPAGPCPDNHYGVHVLGVLLRSISNGPESRAPESRAPSRSGEAGDGDEPRFPADAVEVWVAADTRRSERGQLGGDTLERIQSTLLVAAERVQAGDVVPRVRIVGALRNAR